MRLRLALAATAALGLVAAAFVAASPGSTAVPARCTTQWKLTNGQVAVATTNTATTATVSFQLNAAQRTAVQCAGQFMQLYLSVQNAGVSNLDYALETNLRFSPDRLAEKRQSAAPRGFEPGVTLVNTYLLVADTPYYFTVSWAQPSTAQTATLYQHASRTAQTPVEKSWCPSGSPLTQRCLFTVEWSARTGQEPLGNRTYPLYTT